MGVVLLLLAVVLLSSTSKDSDIDVSLTVGSINISAAIPTEGPGITILFGKINFVIL